MRTTLLAVAIAVAGPNTAAAAEWVVEAHYPDHAALARAAARFGHVIVDDRRSVLRVATDERGMQALADAGLDVGIDEAATAKLRANTQRGAMCAPTSHASPSRISPYARWRFACPSRSDFTSVPTSCTPASTRSTTW